MLKRAPELAILWCQSAKQEPVAHAADDGVVAIDCLGCAKQQPDLAAPAERAAAVRTEHAGPVTVINLAQRCQHLCLGIGPHVEDRAEVFQDDKPEPTNLI